jgi:hypothetical protein
LQLDVGCFGLQRVLGIPGDSIERGTAERRDDGGKDALYEGG